MSLIKRFIKRRKEDVALPSIRIFRYPLTRDIKVLASYKICNNQVRIIIGRRNGEGLYLVNEPSLLDIELKVYSRLSELLKFELEPINGEVDLVSILAYKLGKLLKIMD